MKLQKRKSNHKSNIDIKDSFNVGIGNSTKIIELAFKGLYNHKIRTCVQEIVSNAIDSHYLAKKPLSEIKITSPTEDHLFFEVKDCGIGMSLEELKKNIQAGNSGSVNFDNTHGGYGLGLKSCLAISDSFLIELIKDNNKHLVEIMIDPEGIQYAKVNLISSTKTKEENGFCVKIPCEIKNISKFEYGIRRILRHIEDKPSVNLEITNKEVLIETNDYSYVKNNNKNIYVIVGVVEYTLDQLDAKNDIINLFPNIELGIKFDISEVTPVPSREFLPNEDNVNNLILEKAKKIKQDLMKKHKEKLEKMNAKEIIENLKRNPFFSNFNKEINDYTFHFNQLGLLHIKKDQFKSHPRTAFIKRNYQKKQITSMPKSILNPMIDKHYSQFIFNEEINDYLLKRKIAHNCYLSYENKSASICYDLVFITKDKGLLDPSIVKFLNLRKTSELVDHSKEYEKLKKKKLTGEFTYTWTNGNTNKYEKLSKNTKFLTFQEISKFNREDIENALDEYTRKRKVTLYVISKATQKEFEKMGLKHFDLTKIKNYFKNQKIEQKNALIKLLKNNDKSKILLKKNKKYLPKKLRHTFPDRHYPYHKHAFYEDKIEKKLLKDLSECLKIFNEKNPLFVHLVRSKTLELFPDDKYIKAIKKDLLNEI